MLLSFLLIVNNAIGWKQSLQSGGDLTGKVLVLAWAGSATALCSSGTHNPGYWTSLVGFPVVTVGAFIRSGDTNIGVISLSWIAFATSTFIYESDYYFYLVAWIGLVVVLIFGLSSKLYILSFKGLNWYVK